MKNYHINISTKTQACMSTNLKLYSIQPCCIVFAIKPKLSLWFKHT